MDKLKTLIFIDHYLPGYKFGGPTNSIFNLSKNLNHKLDIYIITSDRDFGEQKPYKGITSATWYKNSDSSIMYLKTSLFFYYELYKHLKRNEYDCIYLNSLFSFKFSIFIVILFKLRLIKSTKLILAPRGELYFEALKFGLIKKRLYLWISLNLGLYNNITWHSTANEETPTILKYYKNANVKLARVIADTSNTIFDIERPSFYFKEENVLKLIFLSRISKEKNLSFALEILRFLKCKVEFHIYGPLEDKLIWKNCLQLISLLPSNVNVQYKGEVEKKFVKSIFLQYDLFFFPTHLENFGHVISESLSVGTPVLISDNTPWRNLQSKSLGWDINLTNKQLFVRIIEDYSKIFFLEKKDIRNKVINSYASLNSSDDLLIENLNLFF